MKKIASLFPSRVFSAFLIITTASSAFAGVGTTTPKPSTGASFGPGTPMPKPSTGATIASVAFGPGTPMPKPSTGASFGPGTQVS